VLVHDGHDDDPSRLLSEQNAKGKGLCEAPANIALDNWIQEGVQTEAIDSILYRCQEPSPEPGLLFLVVFRCRDHLGFGIGMKFDSLHASEA
jgi:hypothetical protein